MVISAHEKINELNSRILKADRIIVTTHMKPDGDAIGSSVGMFALLKELYGKTPRLILADPAPSNLQFLLGGLGNEFLVHKEDKEKTENAISDSDLIICLDFNAFHRTDSLCEPLSNAKADKVLIDHHLNPDLESFSLVLSKTDISSASELLYHIIMGLPVVEGKTDNLPPLAALALMTGMTTDTNNFMNSVYPSTLGMASELLRIGTDRDLIIRNIYQSFKESRIRLQGHILKDLLKITSDNVAYIILDKNTLAQYNIEEGDTEGFVNIPLSIDKVLMSLLIKEDTDRLRVSIRSKKGISANRCSRLHFNGGGHENAAGGRLNIPEDVSDISQVAEYIEKHTHIFMTEENE